MQALGTALPNAGAPTLTPAQCRAARGLVAWSQERLADEAGVSRSTVRDFEKGRHCLNRASQRGIVEALERTGVAVFVTSGGDEGVLLRGTWEPTP